MQLQIKTDRRKSKESSNSHSKNNVQVFSKDYVEFLNEAGWRLEKKFPSNSSNYSDLLEDTDWKANILDSLTSKHYRRDLDLLS